MSYIDSVRLPNNVEFDINTASTSSSLGLVKPDNSTIKVDSNGTIKSNEFYGTLSEVQAAIQAGTITENTTVYINNDSSTESGGGHIIVNSSGTEMTQEDKLKFLNLDVTDDSTNGVTVVSAPIAESNKLGLVKPDGTTISIDANGVISSVVINPIADDVNENVTFANNVIADDTNENVILQ